MRIAALAGTALTFVGSWLLPRAANALLDAIERRLVDGASSAPSATPLRSGNKSSMRQMGGGRGGPRPTNTLAGAGEQAEQVIDDRVFLEKMYQAGARPVFDALDAHPYGFAYPPDDPPGAHDGFNMNRMLDPRATMKVYGDGSKSVWSTEQAGYVAPQLQGLGFNWDGVLFRGIFLERAASEARSTDARDCGSAGGDD